jgi:two-component system response regulator
MPNLNGHQFLASIKNDDHFKRIPVIVLTTSDSQRDITNAYDAHANAYLTKPANLDESYKLAESICDFWLSCVKLPAN